jgi:isoleucyl-tRNA synthetase
MPIVPEKPIFPDEEEKVLKYWEDIDAFKRQLELTKDKPKYTFYDGPPFATGTPHYGHILAGTIKVRFLRQNRVFEFENAQFLFIS